MDKAIEKRQFPRIIATLPIRITPEFLGETVDVSETGLKFVLERPLLLSKAHAKIDFSSDESIDTEFKVIWNKKFIQDGKYTYGGCFIRLRDKQVKIIRKAIILSQIKELTEEIKEKDTSNKVYEFFTVQVAGYLDAVSDLNKRLVDNNISSQEIEEKLAKLNDFIVQKAYELEITIDNRIYVKKLKSVFRKLVNSWTNKGLITKHALEKPKGYPGDYELLEIVYDRRIISEGIGFYYDKDFLENEYAVGVRERKNRMKSILRESIMLANSKQLRILNLACGSCRELRELFIDEAFNPEKQLNIVCLDQEEEALKFSESKLRNVPKGIKFHFLKDDIIGLSLKHRPIKGFDKFDLVYNIGLADYLPDRILKALIRYSYDNVAIGGKAIIAHKDIAKHRPLQPNWFCDWNFYERNENENLELIKSLKLENLSIKIEYLEPSCIFYITLTKNNVGI